MLANCATTGSPAASAAIWGPREERAGDDGVWLQLADRGRGLRGVGGGGAADDPLAHARDQLGRVYPPRVADVVVLRPARAQMRRLVPGPEAGADRGRLRLDGRVAEHGHTVAALDQRAGDRELGRDRPGPVPHGEQVVAAHGFIPFESSIAVTVSVMTFCVARRPRPKSRRSSFQV